MEEEYFYVVMVMQPWDSFDVESEPPLPFKVGFRFDDTMGIGFLPVFEDPDKAVEFANGDRNLISVVRKN